MAEISATKYKYPKVLNESFFFSALDFGTGLKRGHDLVFFFSN